MKIWHLDRKSNTTTEMRHPITSNSIVSFHLKLAHWQLAIRLLEGLVKKTGTVALSFLKSLYKGNFRFFFIVTNEMLKWHTNFVVVVYFVSLSPKWWSGCNCRIDCKYFYWVMITVLQFLSWISISLCMYLHRALLRSCETFYILVCLLGHDKSNFEKVIIMRIYYNWINYS